MLKMLSARFFSQFFSIGKKTDGAKKHTMQTILLFHLVFKTTINGLRYQFIAFYLT
jgi:hypothetical protein